MDDKYLHPGSRRRHLIVFVAVAMVLALGAGPASCLSLAGCGGTHKAGYESVAYVKRVHQPEDEGGNIYIAGLDGSGEKEITSGHDVTDFSVSPDGRKIAFLDARNGPNDSTSRFGNDAFLMDADGGNIRKIPVDIPFHSCAPAFDATGNRLYFVKDGGGTTGASAEVEHERTFERYDVQTGKVEPVFTTRAFGLVSNVYLNRDGTELYYTVVGSQWPGSEVLVLKPGEPAAEEPFMGEEQKNGGYAGYGLMGFSKNGEYVSFNMDKARPGADRNPPVTKRHVRIRRLSTGKETPIEEGSAGSLYEQGTVSRLEFSGVDRSGFVFSKITRIENAGGALPEIEFFRGSIGENGSAPTGLRLKSCMVNNDGTANWHLIKAED